MWPTAALTRGWLLWWYCKILFKRFQEVNKHLLIFHIFLQKIKHGSCPNFIWPQSVWENSQYTPSSVHLPPSWSSLLDDSIYPWYFLYYFWSSISKSDLQDALMTRLIDSLTSQKPNKMCLFCFVSFQFGFKAPIMCFKCKSSWICTDERQWTVWSLKMQFQIV